MLYESIKKRNFLNIFDSLKTDSDVEILLHELKTIPSDYFTSYEHYQYYTRYVLPKIKLVNKEYQWKSSISPHKIYKFKHLLTISLCEKYLVIDFIVDVYRKYEDEDDDHYRFHDRHEHVYLLGFNSDSKLFVNEIPNASIPFRYEDNKVFLSKGVELRIINYNEMINGLGFDYDVADRESVIINREGRYRVQGEIVLRVDRELNNVNEFYQMLVDRSQIVNYVETYIANYIAMALMDLGFSINYDKSIRLRNVVRSNIIDHKDKLMKILERLGDSVVNELRKYMEISAVIYVEDVSEYSDVYAMDYTITSNIGFFHLRISFDYFKPRPFQPNYSDIIVTVGIYSPREYEYCIMCKEIENELIETLRNTPRQNIKMLSGNHLIELKNVYSGSITFRPSRRLEIELIRLPTIVYGIGYYYVDNESEIEIIHKEHGVTKIRFEKPFLVNFTTTMVLHDYIDKSNRIVLENIANGLDNNRKVTQYL